MRSVKGAVLAIFAGILLASFGSSPAHAATSTQSVAFPMYGYPGIGTLWSDIYAAGSQVPWIIANPSNGPGVGTGFDYTQYTTYLNNKPATQRAIGYVYTSYHTRAISDVLKDVDDWYTLYPQISGIFVDLIQNGGAAGDVCYDATLYNYVKGRHPSDLVVMNPGSNIEAAYEPYGDIFANAENTYANYTSWTPLTDGFENNVANSNRFWHIVHTTSSGQLANALSLTRARNAGWVLITDETTPNPYTTVPSYWSSFLSSVGSLPATTIPNRGLTALPSGCLDLHLNDTHSVSAATKQLTHTVASTVANTDTSRTSWGTTTINYSLPSGVSLQASGAGWSCSGTTCSYAGNVAANSSAPAVTANLAVSCNYTSGNAVLTLKNFANNTQTDTVSLTKPTDCVTASTNWSAVSGVIGAATGTDATPPNAPALPDTAATSDVTSPSESARTDQTSNPEQPAENSFSIWLPIGVGAAILAGIVGLVWWVLAHRRTMY